VQAKEITRARACHIAISSQVMQALVRAGILKGVRGPRGGYRLARERRRITAGEIVRLVAELEAADEPELHGASPIGDRVVRR